MLISVVQQSDSVLYIYIYTYTHTHIYIYIYILFHILSIMVYHRVLNIVPCAIQEDLVYPFYIQ